jgi:site-specific DNA-methyltransferase (adenine-specific)
MIDNFVNKIIHGDAIEEMKKLPPKSVNLVCIDPPYNIGKDEWDKLGIVKKGYGGNTENVYGEHYFDWMSHVFVEIERVLKDNGSFFFFHNDFRMMAELDRKIQEHTLFVMKNFIVWNKRFDASRKKGFLDGYVVKTGLTSFNKMCEYILFYTFNNAHKLKKTRTERGVTQIEISKEILSKVFYSYKDKSDGKTKRINIPTDLGTNHLGHCLLYLDHHKIDYENLQRCGGKTTGWYSNIETGKNYVTRETIKPITKHLGLTYDDIVPKFRNQKTNHCVWNYDLDSKKLGHLTPKPVKLIENIILHTTDPNDIVLDCFGGSGTTALAARNLDRKYILIEKEEKYCDLSHQRLSQKGV